LHSTIHQKKLISVQSIEQDTKGAKSAESFFLRVAVLMVFFFQNSKNIKVTTYNVSMNTCLYVGLIVT